MKSLLHYLATIERDLSLDMKRRLFGTVTHVETAKRLAALTFDDGPHPLYTPRLLEILEKYRARATFFMIGANARQYPDIVKQAALAGHAICNHSWDHASLPALNIRECYLQIRRCQRAIAPYGIKIFRPPKGYQSRLSRVILFFLGFRVVTWNVSIGDYLVKQSESMTAELASRLKPGSIIDLHDCLWDPFTMDNMDRSQTLHAVEMLLERVGKSFRFITIQELLKYGSPQKVHWYWSAKISKNS